ncbi:uncharacterized protein LOC121386583 [Gigantopelta aegis]|uniref:uncharacterized protein LOC121386583 n=1 Tax=Gigantopelta aegis TaxID=1735272 RepID=UPI001B887AA0|nr:uncharacterized protein LOC121386583 [Gigantopelta aegis]
METGHVVTHDPPASPPPPPAVVVVAETAADQREFKKRKMSSVTVPLSSDDPDWILVCDKLPHKYTGAVIGDFTDTKYLKGPWDDKYWRQLPTGQGKYQLQGALNSDKLYVTAQQEGLYRQGLLMPGMSNGTIHRILKIVLRDIYPGAIDRNIKRGVWLLLGAYIGNGWISAMVSLIVGSGLLFAPRSFRNVLAPPVVIVLDIFPETHFIIPTRLKKKFRFSDFQSCYRPSRFVILKRNVGTYGLVSVTGIVQTKFLDLSYIWSYHGNSCQPYPVCVLSRFSQIFPCSIWCFLSTVHLYCRFGDRKSLERCLVLTGCVHRKWLDQRHGVLDRRVRIALCSSLVSECPSAPCRRRSGHISRNSFHHTTIFKKKKSNVLFTLDVLFSVVIIGSLVIVTWRGLWELLDLYLFPDDSLKSGYCAFIFSYTLVLLIQIAEKPLQTISKKL